MSCNCFSNWFTHILNAIWILFTGQILALAIQFMICGYYGGDKTQSLLNTGNAMLIILAGYYNPGNLTTEFNSVLMGIGSGLFLLSIMATIAICKKSTMIVLFHLLILLGVFVFLLIGNIHLYTNEVYYQKDYYLWYTKIGWITIAYIILYFCILCWNVTYYKQSKQDKKNNGIYQDDISQSSIQLMTKN